MVCILSEKNLKLCKSDFWNYCVLNRSTCMTANYRVLRAKFYSSAVPELIRLKRNTRFFSPCNWWTISYMHVNIDRARIFSGTQTPVCQEPFIFLLELDFIKLWFLTFCTGSKKPETGLPILQKGGTCAPNPGWVINRRQINLKLNALSRFSWNLPVLMCTCE